MSRPRSGCQAGFHAIQSVTPTRAGYCPLRMLARVGEQTGQAAEHCVNRIPSPASASSAGVS